MNKLEICCDASIKKYPNGREFGCAGAVAIGYGEVFRILPDTTNNRSECIAVLLAIKLAKEIVDSSNEPFDEITIYSDSMYVIGTATQGWKRKKNLDLWEKYDAVIDSFKTVIFKHVKGHSTNVFNNLCDEMAVAASQAYAGLD